MAKNKQSPAAVDTQEDDFPSQDTLPTETAPAPPATPATPAAPIAAGPPQRFRIGINCIHCQKVYAAKVIWEIGNQRACQCAACGTLQVWTYNAEGWPFSGRAFTREDAKKVGK